MGTQNEAKLGSWWQELLILASELKLRHFEVYVCTGKPWICNVLRPRTTWVGVVTMCEFFCVRNIIDNHLRLSLVSHSPSRLGVWPATTTIASLVETSLVPVLNKFSQSWPGYIPVVVQLPIILRLFYLVWLRSGDLRSRLPSSPQGSGGISQRFCVSSSVVSTRTLNCIIAINFVIPVCNAIPFCDSINCTCI